MNAVAIEWLGVIIYISFEHVIPFFIVVVVVVATCFSSLCQQHLQYDFFFSGS